MCHFFVPYLSSYKDLLYVGILKLFFNVFLVEWLYKGLEDFRYITIRSISVRFLYLLLVFIFVRSATDYVVYFFLTSMLVVVNAVINFLAFKTVLCIFLFREITPKKYVKPFFYA